MPNGGYDDASLLPFSPALIPRNALRKDLLWRVDRLIPREHLAHWLRYGMSNAGDVLVEQTKEALLRWLETVRDEGFPIKPRPELDTVMRECLNLATRK